MAQRNPSLSALGEFGFIDRVKKQAKSTLTSAVIKGIGDDTAVCRYSNKEYLLLTTDMLVESVHFQRGMGGEKIGWKALACNISDIAAMGGIPKYALISIGMPSSAHTDFIHNLYKGIQKAARHFDVAIVGGDTVRDSKIVVNVALTGLVAKKHLVLRDGARKGDQIFVTGSLGNSLKRGKHLNFMPRLEEAQYLVKKYKPTAMIDISDGLIADLYHILEESEVGARIEENNIRKAPGATLERAFYDGEDFELLFAVKKKDAQRLLKTSQPFSFIHIGEITDKKKTCVCVMKNGQEKKLQRRGYTHF